MVDLTTDATLLRALEAAAMKKPSSEEIERQRVSFIRSAVKNRDCATEVKIKQVLAEQDGVAHA
jgi:hypothetical protein